MLYHRDLGGAGKPPLVILHGILGSSRNWQTAGRDLAEHFHVFALDLRNHGSSPHADSMSFKAMADDLREWLDGQGLDRVVLLGHSMGGKVAMKFACDHPERVGRLIVVDIAPKAYFWAARRREFKAMRNLDLARVKSRGEAEQQLAAEVPDWATRKFFATNLERTPEGRWQWQINLAGISAALADLERNPLAPGDRYAGPVLVIAGGRSPYVGPADEATVRGHFPAAKFEILPESGHNPHMDAREKFVRAILQG